jgi:uncharacterized membrane protein
MKIFGAGIGFVASGIIIMIFGALMTKKTEKGNELYRKLAGFKEFLRSVEKDRLREFLKQDENYFDKVLPYAIVFDIAHTWKDKLKDLERSTSSMVFRKLRHIFYVGFYE